MMSSLQRQAIRNNLPPLHPGPSRGGRHRGIGGKKDYTPTRWTEFFSNYVNVETKGNNFRVYLRGDSGPVLVLLHGGGYSALTWALFSVHMTSLVACRIVAVDLRGHGDTVTMDDDDLSIDQLASDVGGVIETMYGSSPPPIILVGHSMGGAIAVHVTSLSLIPSQIGLVVIDVVEGTAIEALTSMQGFLRSRPAGFKSIEQAIEYCIRSGQVRNLESARVSVPGQIKNCVTGLTATNDLEMYEPSPIDDAGSRADIGETIQEDPREEDTATELDNVAPEHDIGFQAMPCHVPSRNIEDPYKYTWRINLGRTEKFWYGWFSGLSQKFLNNCPVPKLLLLAGIDRLDKELMVGQMQGKFQMQVVGQSGHAMQEDIPDKIGDLVAAFMVRNRFAEQIGYIRSSSPRGDSRELDCEDIDPLKRF